MSESTLFLYIFGSEMDERDVIPAVSASFGASIELASVISGGNQRFSREFSLYIHELTTLRGEKGCEFY